MEDCNFEVVIGRACETCKYSANFSKGLCSYGTPVCRHDSRIKCRYEKSKGDVE